MASLGLEGFSLAGELEWNVVYRNTLLAQEDGVGGYIQIPPVVAQSPGPLILAGGFANYVKENWYTAGFLSVGAPTPIDSAAAGPQIAYTGNVRIPLFQYQMFHFPNVLPKPYSVRVSFPRWLRDIRVEIYWFDAYPDLNYDAVLVDIQDRVA